ncbi:MAG: Ribosomal protein S12 methylthiotransferase RimO [Clostridia bacterium 41_269]|nr:MAG: Ribosomal protein S12 methylthiotransferase RimO [Clostridia bacterium 41_269]
MKKFYLVHLGCSKNMIDSEMLIYDLLKCNYIKTKNPSEAEVIIINTCAFTEEADEESITAILEAAEYKKIGSCKYLIVIGCLSQKYKEELLNEIPEIDAIFGTGDFMKVKDIISEGIKEKYCVVGRPEYNYPKVGNRFLLTPKHTAYLKIAEGCVNCCSYCIIPKLRGSYRSRPFNIVLEEAKILVEKGVKEICLVAQDTSLYGRDLNDKTNFTKLLECIAKECDVPWLRFLYYYPTRVDKTLLNVMKKNDNICKYLDIPLQHVNADLLKKMNREGDYKTYIDLIFFIKDEIPDITLRSTFIVGFPGEGQKEFEELVDFLEKAEFDWAGFFAFSPQIGTPAYNLGPRVQRKEIEKRLAILREMQLKISEKRNMRFLNRKIPALVEGKSDENDETYVGRAENQAPEIDGQVIIKGAERKHIGSFVNVYINHVYDYDLMGEVVGEYS